MYLTLNPSEIRYTQDSISYRFRCGLCIGDTLDDLLTGKSKITDIPRISVTRKDDKWYSGDNRRLWVFKKLNEFGKLNQVEVSKGYVNISKWTTVTDGISIRTRGDPGGTIWRRYSGRRNASSRFDVSGEYSQNSRYKGTPCDRGDYQSYGSGNPHRTRLREDDPVIRSYKSSANSSVRDSWLGDTLSGMARMSVGEYKVKHVEPISAARQQPKAEKSRDFSSQIRPRIKSKTVDKMAQFGNDLRDMRRKQRDGIQITRYLDPLVIKYSSSPYYTTEETRNRAEFWASRANRFTELIEPIEIRIFAEKDGNVWKIRYTERPIVQDGNNILYTARKIREQDVNFRIAVTLSSSNHYYFKDCA